MGLHPAPSSRAIDELSSGRTLFPETVQNLSDASEMAPALNEPLTQVQLPLLPDAESVSPRPGLFVNSSHLNNNQAAKDSSSKIASPSQQPIHLQLPRIASYSSNGYAKPSFQLAFIQQISTANGPAPSTGSSPVQHHMDRNSLPTNTQHSDTANASPHNDPGSAQDLLSNDLDLSDTNLDLHDVDESTIELINDALGSPTSHLDQHHVSDNNNTMGLQKDYLKDNTDMEQMLGDLANTSDIDLMQVFKSLAPSGSDNLCDLASGLALFNDVDVMGIGLEEVNTPLKEPDTQDIRNEIKKRQTQMMRKCDFLMRRLRKLQTSSMQEHVGEEVSGLFDYTQKLLKRKERETKTISTLHPVTQSPPKHLTADSCAASQVKSLLGRLDSVASDQQCVLKKTGSKCSEGGLIATNSLSTNTRHRGSSGVSGNRLVPCFDSAFSGQVELAAGHLHTELKIVAEAIDSDATASSSGGDSGDEFNAYTKQQAAQQQHQNPELQAM